MVCCARVILGAAVWLCLSVTLRNRNRVKASGDGE